LNFLLLAATAVLDCIGDAASANGGGRWRGSERVLALDTPRKVVAIQFRSTSLKGWHATGAKLVVHFERGRCDGPLLAAYLAKFDEKALSATRPAGPFLEAACTEAGASGGQIDRPASIAQGLVDEPNGAILLASRAKRGGPVLHSRETVSFTPRLLVEGQAKLVP
jgi:hypothetical protein